MVLKEVLVSVTLWASIVSLPLVLTHNDLYKSVFAEEYYDATPQDYWTGSAAWPSPVGLTIGILAVVVGQLFTLCYFYLWSQDYLGVTKSSIQKVCVMYSLV